MNPQKKLKTYNITYRPDADNRYNTKTVTYKADNIKSAEQMFYDEHPEQKEQRYLEIHSPLSNYAIDAENEKIAETSTTDGDTTTSTTTTTTTTTTNEANDTTTTFKKIAENPNKENNNTTTSTTTTTTMKKFNILNTFKLVNDYIKEITMLLIGLIPLLLLGVVIFGDDFFLGNIVVYNIQNILDSMGGFVGIITLLLIVYFYSRIQVKK